MSKLEEVLRKRNIEYSNLENKYNKLKEDFIFNYDVIKERENENDFLINKNKDLENISFFKYIKYLIYIRK